jgi:hypothetical protein
MVQATSVRTGAMLAVSVANNWADRAGRSPPEVVIQLASAKILRP